MNNNLNELKRQPAEAIVLVFIQTILSLLKSLWPFLLLMLFRAEKKGRIDIQLLLIPSILVVLLSIFNYFYFKYGIIENNFKSKKGFLKKVEINIPLENIQAVHINQTLLDRILNLVKLTIDATGSTKNEAELHIKKEEALTLKQLILQKQENKHTISEEKENENFSENIVTELSTKDLIKLGISANHIETLAVLIGLSFSFFQNLKDLFDNLFKEILEKSERLIIISGFTMVVYFILFVVIISVIVSFFRTIIKYLDFQLKKDRNGFSVSSGVVNKTERVIKFNKIQYISWSANWIRKYIPIYLLDYKSVGIQSDEKLNVKIPVTSFDLLNKLLNIYDQIIPENHPHYRISKQYIIRKTLILGVIPALILGTILFLKFGNIGILSLLLIPIVYGICFIVQNKYKIFYNQDVLHIRKGLFGDHQILLQWHKIQNITIVQSYYQQTNKLANINIYTAAGPISIPYLKLEDAHQILNFGIYTIENRLDRNWM